ncbi:MAG: hypothetical protein M1826_000595 [Phylliscum demangeonii]|nr:MAG: hypothetical protein M1826_000595 [Phylliscum demangeonii]
MTSKRSRITYEADLQAQQSPFVAYGTPLPPLDPDVRDDGSYVPIWKQEVTDDRGRKRLHGAFTGGFSAGYFNTVGSKDGWTPSTFVSSRSKRPGTAAPIQRPEDFMDEEDLAEAAGAQQLQTSASFAGLGLTGDDASRGAQLMDVFRSEGDTMGVKLLRKMGWRDGQGVGPKVRRQARLGGDDDDDGGGDTHWFAPENSPLITLVRKDDRKGIGYRGEARLGAEPRTLSSGRRLGAADDGEDDEMGLGPAVIARKRPKANSPPKAGIGVGILNDTGSDDEDPYEIGPRIVYHKVIGGGGEKKGKPLHGGRPKASASNPLLGAKPVFISKKASSTPVHAGFRRGHDGRLPLDGFVLSAAPEVAAADEKRYAPPDIPEDWTSSRQPAASGPPSSYISTADAARASALDPNLRASLLGETQLPGKSVFDYISPGTRDRIAAVSGHANLPRGRGEPAPKGFAVSEKQRAQDRRALIPDLEPDVARKALERGVAGWMPYTDDEPKRARYRAFLEAKAGLRAGIPDPGPDMAADDWLHELREFAHAAALFKPMTGLMATRFTSSTARTGSGTGRELGSDGDGPSGAAAADDLLRKATPKADDPAEAAAKVGLFGPMTRSTHAFFPTRLLCKRFNVKPPSHVQPDADRAAGEPSSSTVQAESSALPSRSLELVSKAAVDDILRHSERQHPSSDTGSIPEQVAVVVVDPARNGALEVERPGEAVFKAIFGSDDEDDD